MLPPSLMVFLLLLLLMVIVVVVVERGWGVLKGGLTSVESNRIRGSSTSRESSAKPIGRDPIAIW